MALTLTLSLLLIYHPELNRKRETISEFEMPKIMLTYGMIGMIAGFLFVEVGEFIGFLIFGLGGLIRVRTDPGSSTDTGRVIVITLIGLCVGLRLVHIALLATLVIWVIIYFVERKNLFKLTVHFENLDGRAAITTAYRQAVAAKGWNIVREKTSIVKSQVQFLISTDRNVERDVIEDYISRNIEDELKSSIELETV